MRETIPVSDIDTIILACEAGMGSSLMVVSALKKKMKKSKVKNVKIAHKAARTVPEDTPFVVVHEGMAKMVRAVAPNAVIMTFKLFLNDPVFDRIVTAFVEEGELPNMVAYEHDNS